MLKLFVVASMALMAATSVASAQTRKEAPTPPPSRQPTQNDKSLPTPDEVGRWMNDTIEHILEPVDTIVRPQSR